MTPASRPSQETLLDQLRYTADPLADDTVNRIVGPWQALPQTPDLQATLDANTVPWQRVAAVNRLFGKWQDNQSLRDWRADPATTPPDIAAELEQFVRTAQVLPDWADARKIERAEQIFIDHSLLSCVLLFCSSLPECYVIPDLSSVLQATGQLDQHADYRIRATAAMIFPVMMPGGLMSASGSGMAQIIKVRLIHATVRNLLLRGSPNHAITAHAQPQSHTDQGVVPPLASAQPTSEPKTHSNTHANTHANAQANAQAKPSMQSTLFALGWDVNAQGLPCNQEELAYTLLTFGYVVLRSLRKLGLALAPADEEAYLHAWNVVGHVLGLRADLRVERMADAEVLFAQLQARGIAQQVTPDPRARLTLALMQAMQQVLPRALKPMPVLLTRFLCGDVTSAQLGLNTQVSWVSKLLFALGMGLILGLDRLIRLVSPGFTFSGLLTRWAGERFMAQLLLSQTRPLQLPWTLRQQMQGELDKRSAKKK
jgi:hypothetical protein